MVKSSIKKNYILNLINTLTGLVFPLITFPYASRILFAEGIGQVQFFQSIIDYIALCSALGIPLYAVREIARDTAATCPSNICRIYNRCYFSRHYQKNRSQYTSVPAFKYDIII